MRESSFGRRFQFAMVFVCQVSLKELSGHDKPQPKSDEWCARPGERPFETLAIVASENREEAWNLDKREQSSHCQTNKLGDERDDLQACGRAYDRMLFHFIAAPKLRFSAPAEPSRRARPVGDA